MASNSAARHGLARLVAAAHKVVHALDHLARALGLLGDAHGHAHVAQVMPGEGGSAPAPSSSRFSEPVA
jgi:hypothetical protein